MNDFDFFIGSWHVVNRRRRTLFAGSDEWETFPGTTTCRTIFNGGGNTEEIIFPTLGTRGLSLRLFDTERKEWSIYSARWEQEFSADGGQTWESNWVMEFTRA